MVLRVCSVRCQMVCTNAHMPLSPLCIVGGIVGADGAAVGENVIHKILKDVDVNQRGEE